MKYFNANKKNALNNLEKVLNARKSKQQNQSKIVKKLLLDVKKYGDKSVLKYEKKFSKLKTNTTKIKFSEEEIKKILKKVDKKLKKSIDIAFTRIKYFHTKQKFYSFKYKDKFKNELSYKYSPIERVGVYVPGGTASYPSTVIMNTIPAVVAGVEDITMVTPMTNTTISPSVLYAAKICGIKKIYCIGGAQAVAALAYGTKTIKSVNKIVGPGNIYVAEAKRQVSGFIGIDMFAGPSEVVIIADEKNDPKIVAADLIAQAEHDQSAQSILLTTDQKLGDAVNKEVENQIDSLPRKDIAASSWENNGKIIITQNLEEAVLLSNKLAPEHLELLVDNPEDILKRIKNAGAVFMGRNTPEALGDYLAGPSHVLPTSRSAKFSSGLSVFDFLKKISLVEFSKEGIEQVGDSAIKIADNEGLDGHSRSIEYRLTKK